MLTRINKLLARCDSADRNFPATELYNEGWLLRIVMDWFAEKGPGISHELFFMNDEADWYSEAHLPTQFRARYNGDNLAESRTEADGVIGHFQIGKDSKAGAALRDNADQIKVLEAKMYSKLSSGVTNADYFNQAARAVACIAEMFSEKKLDISEVEDIGYYALAPEEHLKKAKSFNKYTSKDDIKYKAKKRVEEYEEKTKRAKLDWYKNWFMPALNDMEIKCLSWENIISFMKSQDKSSAEKIEKFYEKCRKYNS